MACPIRGGATCPGRRDWGLATGGIHHVGSTAVPHLDAKPIIDILIGVESLARRFEHDREDYTQAKTAFISEVLAGHSPRSVPKS